MCSQAFLFDLNGTMVDDMSYHINAWHRIFNELGAAFSLERTKRECYGKNHEILERIFPRRFSEAEKNKMSIEKEIQYQKEFAPHLRLIDGLPEFLEKAAKQNIKMAIGSAAILFNIDFVLDGLNIRHYFDAIVSADDVHRSKPDPETYLSCAKLLGVAPENCIVFEDAPKGVECAVNAGMQSIVLTTMHISEEFLNYPGILLCEKNYLTINPALLLQKKRPL